MLTPVLGCVLAVWGASASKGPVALRVESMGVAPAHLPPLVVRVKNVQDEPYQGTIVLKAPDGWIADPQKQAVALKPSETGRLVFQVRRGVTREENSYPIEVSATGNGTTVTCRQEIACCSAPYFKAQIDGKTDDWKDAIPVTFFTGGKKAEIRTFWNRREFLVLVAVEEDQLVPWSAGADNTPCDAVQIAVASGGTVTGVSPDEAANRYEFLLVSAGEDGRCFPLAGPETPLRACAAGVILKASENSQAKVAVSRQGTLTYYECSIPFRELSRIRPGEGREFCFSVLVHDPDGTGIRDWGEAAGLWPWESSDLAWSKWQGACWPEKAPFDNRTPWGMCSSKY